MTKPAPIAVAQEHIQAPVLSQRDIERQAVKTASNIFYGTLLGMQMEEELHVVAESLHQAISAFMDEVSSHGGPDMADRYARIFAKAFGKYLKDSP